MIKAVKALMLLLLFTNVACAQEPVAPVSAPEVIEQGSDDHQGEGDVLDLMALVYEGKDDDFEPCKLYVSGFEEDRNGEHHHEIVTKIGYLVDGEEPNDTAVGFKNFNLNTGAVSSIGSDSTNTVPALVSMVLKNGDTNADYNNRVAYEQDGSLLQALRIMLNDIDYEGFSTALDEVLEDNLSFEENLSALNQVDELFLVVDHIDHADKLSCSKFTLTGMERVQFKIGAEHDHGDHEEEEGDDDDDHDHHHGHDH